MPFLRGRFQILNINMLILIRDFAGTVAYLIKKSAVNKIINDEHHIVPFWLADDYPLFGSYFKLDICVIRPLLAIENPTNK